MVKTQNKGGERKEGASRTGSDEDGFSHLSTGNLPGMKRANENVKRFDELFSCLKNDSMSGRFSKELFEECYELSHRLQRETTLNEIFDSLLRSWQINAFRGELNLEGIEDYRSVLQKPGLTIDTEKLDEILDIARVSKTNELGSAMISDQDYMVMLKSGAEEYVRIDNLRQLQITGDTININVDELVKTVEFIRVVEERYSDDKLRGILADELKYKLFNYDRINSAVSQSGISDALEVGSGLLVRELRYSAIPDTEHELLRRCGITNTEGYLKLLVTMARERYFSSMSPQHVFDEGKTFIELSINNLKEAPSPTDPQKEKRILRGISKILVGAVMAGGDISSVIGTSGISIGGAIVSVGTSIVSIHDGVDDLRGQ